MTGGGGSSAIREALDDEIARDAAMELCGFSASTDIPGASTPASMPMFMIPFSANIELRVGEKGFNPVMVFVGPVMSVSNAQIDDLGPMLAAPASDQRHHNRLSSLLQQAAKKDKNEAVKTTVIQVSWHF